MYQEDCDGIRGEIVNLMPALRAFSRTFCKTQTDADDLVQETVVKALANIHHFTEGTRLKSWLFTIMRNTFCSRFRIAQREAPGASECVSGNGVTQPPQEWSVMASDMQRAVGNLPSCYRDALEYVILDGKSYEEAAQHFDCAVGTIKSRINRARQHLAQEFGELN